MYFLISPVKTSLLQMEKLVHHSQFKPRDLELMADNRMMKMKK